MAQKTTQRDLRKLLTSNKLVIGSDRTLSLLRQNKLSAIILSSNCSEKIKAEIEHYSAMQKLEIEHSKHNNEELGTICKKPFPISILSVLKD